MKTAIAILNWNGEKLLPQFLPSVINNSKNATIYVIDNASTDNSIELLTTQFPSVKIIQNKGNYGFAQGYNEGLKEIDAEYFCLLNYSYNRFLAYIYYLSATYIVCCFILRRKCVEKVARIFYISVIFCKNFYKKSQISSF